MPREEQDIQKALGARRTWKSQFFVAARAIELSRKPVKRELHKDERQVNFAENFRDRICKLQAGGGIVGLVDSYTRVELANRAYGLLPSTRVSFRARGLGERSGLGFS